MKALHTEIDIDASPEQVWCLLTDFSRLPTWNPFMQQASGVVREGEQIEVHLQAPDGPKMVAKPILTKVAPNRELRWLGHLWVKGIFDGEHYFQIEPLANNQVRLRHGEHFRGLLAVPVLALIGKSTLAGFVAMNQALKIEAEKENNTV